MNFIVDFLSPKKPQQPSKGNSLGAAYLIAFILAFSSFLFLYKLGSEPLHNDEARYAEIVTESFSSHNFFSLVYRGEPYFNKPPLLFWLVDISREFTGNLQTAVRLPSAVAAILLVAATMLVVFEATRSLYAAGFAGAVLTTIASLALLARSGRFDTLVTLFIVLAIYAFIRAFEDRRWFLFLGACIGLAILTKGPVVAFAVVAMFAVAWMYRRLDWVWDPYFWSGVGVSLLIALPWHIYETILFGEEFWNAYIWLQIIDRAQQNIVSIALPLSNTSYVMYLFEFLAPWSTLFVISLFAAPFLWSRLHMKARVYFFASCTVVFSVLVVCFLMQSKAYRYLIPFYPFMAISIAIVAFEISRLNIPRIKMALAIGCIALGIYAAVLSVYNGFLLNPSYPYSTDTPVSAYDEQAVAGILLARHAKIFYVYDTADIGGIMYYSHLTNPYYFPLYGYYPGLYFVLPTQYLPLFQNTHPRLQFHIFYQGSDLTLAQEFGEASESLVAPYCGI